MTTAAIVLAGGRSRRMGRDKASLPFGDETLLQRVVRTAREAVDEIVVVGREGQDLRGEFEVVARDPAEGLGPLAGIAAGLEAMRAERAFVTACDAPFLTPAFVRCLLDACKGRHAAVPLVGGYHMTTAAAYARDALPVARSLLADGLRRPLFLVERVDARIVEEAELPDLDSLRNCNTPDDYARALADAGFR